MANVELAVKSGAQLDSARCLLHERPGYDMILYFTIILH